jgi:hypothetical protein
MKKYLTALTFTVVTFVTLYILNDWTGWNIDLLVGWLPITAWFSIVHIINVDNPDNVKNGVTYKTTPWSMILIAFGITIIMAVFAHFVDITLMVTGAIVGFIYNVITAPEKIVKKS